ncbi:MAG: nucleoside permease [Chitinophagales bacterium]|nr:nucleoside permease [Chitinophagales bacterium]
MSIKLRLTVMNFLQFFLWGSWLTSIGTYLTSLNFSGGEIGAVFTTLGIAAFIMPAIMGIVADKYLNAEKLYGICHVLGGLTLVWAANVSSPSEMYRAMLLNSLFYMPTISLCYSISYHILSKSRFDVIKDFPNIRVWGTIGFILAMWIVDFMGWTANNYQLYLGAISSIALGMYAFSLPACETQPDNAKSLTSALGLDALVLFKSSKMVIFFVFAVLLGAALQITNAFGQDFLVSFKSIEEYSNSFGVQHPGFLMSISQISETVFILSIPFFLKKFGIKKVMLMAMIAWFLRFALFSIGNPGTGLILIILSNIVYGMAFDFFTISGSLFVEKETDAKIRSSAQGLYLMATNGIGIILGGYFSGYVVDMYTIDKVRQWSQIWLVFSSYAFIMAILFFILFKHKHNPADFENVSH